MLPKYFCHELSTVMSSSILYCNTVTIVISQNTKFRREKKRTRLDFLPRIYKK